MAILIISISPKSNLDVSSRLPSRVVVRYQKIVFKDDEGSTTSREVSLSFDVSPEFIGRVEIFNYVPETPINLSFHGLLLLSEEVKQGILLLSVKELERGNEVGTFLYEWKLNKDQIDKIIKRVNQHDFIS